uniref:Endonuclease/exonuclease/phosphatase domain-containing protein n=1 Tax=viral metagenome TaxID=1070528 RepID=A0A6C0ET28_9ZZZZ
MLRLLIVGSLLVYFVFCDTECPTITAIGDRRKDKTKFRLVQYNVEWLFIDYYSNMDCPGDGCTWKNQSEAETHMNYVSDIVKKLNPDLINFCEVEGCDELNILKDKLDETYTPYLKKGTDTSTGQNVGMLTRVDPLKSLYRTEMKYNYPIPGSKCGYTGSTGSTGVSKHYITEFTISNKKIAFIAAHLLAIPTDSARCSQREAQASILQSIIYDYITRNYEIIMIGDFNDYDAEILDMNNNKPISYVLDILKGLYGDFKGKYTLNNIAANINQTSRYSDWWDSDNNCTTASNKDYSMIDHILVTTGIKNSIINAFIYHGYSEYCGKYNSDHYPVVVDLAI